ncbi:MAG: AAA family ATPase [Candidatus Altiarchaeota archaeon]
MMEDKKVIGLIGRIGSGKSIVAEHLVENYGAVVYRFSDVLKDVLNRVHKPITRENLQDLGVALRSAFDDQGILAEVLRADIMESDSKLIIVDGIRYYDEVEMVKGVGGVTLYVKAPPEVRYERVVKRGTRGERHISFDEFKVSEGRETERMIDEIGSNADYTIENTGTLDELKSKVDELMS